MELFTEGTRAYLVMERINGRNLRQLVEAGELPQNMVIPLAVQMCDLLSYLHQCDPPVVHRDSRILNYKQHVVYIAENGTVSAI